MAVTYRVAGTTDDANECEICGKTDLRGTVILDTGNGHVYAGSDCAARLTGRPVKEIRTAAARADRARKAADRAAAAAARRTSADSETAAFLAWVSTRYGVAAAQPADLWDRVPGMTPFALRKAWRAEHAA
jgi:hypothetical protein